MLLSLIRILFGFIVACLAAGLVEALFVITPWEIALAGPAGVTERLQGVGVLMLLGASQAACVTAPLAAVVVVVGEWKRLRSVIYYVLGGLLIAIAGFAVQRLGEAGAVPLTSDYALRAYLAAGLVAGVVYGRLSGRYAGARAARG